MNNLQIVFNPTQSDLNEIEEWLEAEYRVTKQGFYTDRGVLGQSFKEKTLIILKMEGKAVSFIAWKPDSKYTAKITIAETHPDFRRNGFLKMLLDGLIGVFQKSDIKVIDLLSISSESEVAWKHLGFIEFPESKRGAEQEQKELFKVIVPVLEIGTVADSETLELWHLDTHEISGLDPNVSWNLSFIASSRSLQKPIVYPAYYDWHLCWKKNGAIAYEGRVKRFPRQISFGRFMVVSNLQL